MKHITQLEWAYIGAVSPLWVDNQALAVSLPETLYWQRIPIIGLVSLEHSCELEKGTRRHIVKLSALLQDCPNPHPFERRAYRLTDSEGKRYLLGHRDAPLPLSIFIDTRADNPSERAVRTLTITADMPLLLIK